MTIFDYFECEKRLLEIFNAVGSKQAKDAVYCSLAKVLDEHRTLVSAEVYKLEKRISEKQKNIVQMNKGETPDYVKNTMASFGFHELEECSDFYDSADEDSEPDAASKTTMTDRSLGKTDSAARKRAKKRKESGKAHIDKANKAFAEK